MKLDSFSVHNDLFFFTELRHNIPTIRRRIHSGFLSGDTSWTTSRQRDQSECYNKGLRR